MAQMRESHRERGFTLIDLAFALAVAAILASVVTINMLGSSEKDLAEATVRQIQAILDAARWYQYNNQRILNKSSGRDIFSNCTETGLWPGQVRPPSGQYKCKGTMVRDQLIKDLQGVDSSSNIFLPPVTIGTTNRVLTTMWGEDLEFSLDSPGPNDGLADPYLLVPVAAVFPELAAEGRPFPCRPTTVTEVQVETNCWFRVSTNVPEKVANIFRTTLPNAYCESIDGVDRATPVCPGGEDMPSDFTRCCAMISRPGTEPRFQEWMQFRPPIFCAPWSISTLKQCPNNLLPPE